MDDTKKWFASKTIWTNVIAGAIAIGTAFGLDIGLDAQSQTAIVGGIVTIANVILRLVTKTAVAA